MDDEIPLNAAHASINSGLHSDLYAVLYTVLFASAHQRFVLRPEFFAPGRRLMGGSVHAADGA